MANYKGRIANIEEAMKQLEKRKKEYLQKDKTAERKARNHRISKRGGFLESILPDIKEFSDEQFEAFMKKTLLTDYATREMNKIKAQNAPPEQPAAPETDGRAAGAAAEKPVEAAKTSETAANANGKDSRTGAA